VGSPSTARLVRGSCSTSTLLPWLPVFRSRPGPVTLPPSAAFSPDLLPGIQPGLGHRVHVLFVRPPNLCPARLAREKERRNQVALTPDDAEVHGDAAALPRMLPRVREVVAEVYVPAAGLTVTNAVVVGRLHVGPGLVADEVKPE